MEPEKRKLRVIYESVCLNLPARLPVSKSVLRSYLLVGKSVSAIYSTNK